MDLKKVWDDYKKTPVEQVDDYTRDIFSEDATAKQRIFAGERVVAATLITSIAVVATGGFVVALPLAFEPFLAPLVGAVAGVAIDEINDLLGDFGLHRSNICDHPELQPKTMNDGTWLHYPGRKYNGRYYQAVPGDPLQGWGGLGLQTVTPYLGDYPQIQGLNVNFDLNRRVLQIPNVDVGYHYVADKAVRDFLNAWYVVYAVIKENNFLQPCSALSSEEADKQEEAALLSFETLWNRVHDRGAPFTFPGGVGAGDDLTLSRHSRAIVVNTGAVQPRRVLAGGSGPNGGGGGASNTAKNVMLVAGLGLVGVAAYSWYAKKPLMTVLRGLNPLRLVKRNRKR